ncbi:MAG: hypothetical protein AAGI15_16560 [Pseudomonadota bacterium]
MRVLESRPPTRLVLQTGSPGRFEGRYVAEFAETGRGVTGTFTETSVALGLVPKVMRALFVDGQALIERYSAQAQAELRRRAAGG